MRGIAFLGPSLSADEARALAPSFEIRGPARQGDLWRALEVRPKVIALIDGVFESEPSVWHHEILAALSAGVRVFGASSMGALRAAELHTNGMVGVGEIFAAFRDGRLTGDDEVALLHADAEFGWRGMTVPLVNVRHTAQEALRARKLSPAKARQLVQVAAAMSFRDRTWRHVLETAGLSPSAKDSKGLPLVDLKAKDARACLKLAEKAVRPRTSRSSRSTSGPEGVAPRVAQGSSLVRLRRLQGSAKAAQVMPSLRARSDADELAARGLRRMLLSAWARSRGLTIDPAAVAAERTQWLDAHLPPEERDDDEAVEAFLRLLGLDDASLHVLMEDVLLERAVLQDSQRWISDGPAYDEALAAEAKLSGLWAKPRTTSSPRR